MLDEALGAKVTVHLHQRPHLPQTDSDATLTGAVVDRGADVGEVASVAHVHLLQDLHPPSCLLRREGHRGGYYVPSPQTQQPPPYLNLMKRFANWNECYSCGFIVAEGNTSQTCPQYLRKPDHNCYFTRQNVQQYVDAGYGCSTKNRHKTILPQM